jgi:hypothetical protein
VTEALWLMLALGAVLGFLIGRWSAENRRARSDMDKVWNSRRSYRDS